MRLQTDWLGISEWQAPPDVSARLAGRSVLADGGAVLPPGDPSGAKRRAERFLEGITQLVGQATVYEAEFAPLPKRPVGRALWEGPPAQTQNITVELFVRGALSSIAMTANPSPGSLHKRSSPHQALGSGSCARARWQRTARHVPLQLNATSARNLADLLESVRIGSTCRRRHGEMRSARLTLPPGLSAAAHAIVPLDTRREPWLLSFRPSKEVKWRKTKAISSRARSRCSF